MSDKVKNEGSRGGHVIGHTKSGLPIYESHTAKTIGKVAGAVAVSAASVVAAKKIAGSVKEFKFTKAHTQAGVKLAAAAAIVYGAKKIADREIDESQKLTPNQKTGAKIAGAAVAVSGVAAAIVFHNKSALKFEKVLVRDGRAGMIQAKKAGDIVGSVHFSSVVSPKRFNVNTIHVSEAYRRQGIGKKLLDKVMGHAQSMGAKTVEGSLVTPEAAKLRAKLPGTKFMHEGEAISAAQAEAKLSVGSKNQRVEVSTQVPKTLKQKLGQHAKVIKRKVDSLSLKYITRRNAEAAGEGIGSTIVGTLVGMIPGSAADSLYEQAEFSQLGPKVEQDLKGGEQVDAKKATHALSEFSDVHVITNEKELLASGLSDEEKQWAVAKKGRKLLPEMPIFEAGNNAAAYEAEDGSHYVFASKKVNKQVLGHELGHIRDYRAGRIDKKMGYFGVMSGEQLDQEKSAWENSPFKGPADEPIKTDALGTYKVVRNGARIFGGVTVGTGLAAGAFAIAKKLR